MSDYDLPDLPSDEELGIAGLSEEDLSDTPSPPSGKDPEPPSGRDAPQTTPPKDGGPPWRGLITLAVLLLGVWLSSSYRTLPSTRAANAPDSVFASGRALSQLVEVARAPRPIGSPEHDRVRELLLDRLRELGLEPQVQETTQLVTRRDRARAATVRNLVARVTGTESTGAVVLTAHYDAVPGSPGAGDDATGLVTILETLRAVRAGAPLRNDLIVLLTDAEEEGLLGARAFVERHPWMGDVRTVISVEMRGTGGPSIMFETGAENGWIVERLSEADPHPLANSLSMEVYARLPNDTDFSPFRDAGIQGLNFAAIGRSNRYHQPTDAAQNVQEATLQHHGERVLAMTRALGNADLGAVRGPDRAYVTLPGIGLLTVPVGFTVPVTLGLVALLLLVTFLASVRGTRSRGFLLSAVLSAVVLGLSAAAGWALLRWVLPLHPVWGTGALTPPVHVQGPYLVALAAAALGVTVTVFSLGHRWMSPLEATLGALLFPVVTLVAATFMAPAAALNLQGPLAATTLLLALLAGVGLHRAQGTVAWVASLVLAMPVLAFLVPVLELVSMAVTLRAAPLIGAMMALTLLFMLPALSSLDLPNRWWAPVTAFLVAAVATGVGLLQRNPTADRPAPSALVYLMDRDGEGLPVSARWASVEGPGAEWAAEAAGGTLQDTSALADYGLPSRGFRTREAPLAAVPAPEVRILSDTVVAGERRVALAVRSRMGAEYLAIHLPEGVDVLGIWGAGSGASEPGLLAPSVRRIEHWGRPSGSVRVELAGSPSSDWTLPVVEYHLRPQEIFGADRFARPQELVGYGGSLSDRAVIRTPYRVGATLGEGLPPTETETAGGTAADAGGPDTLDADTLRPDTLAPRPDTAAPDSGGLPMDGVPPDTTLVGDSLAPPDTGAASGTGPGGAAMP